MTLATHGPHTRLAPCENAQEQTAAGVLAARDSTGGSVDRVKPVLSEEDRFVRASRTTWGLRRWGVSEYVNIAHAIGECIDAAGGKAGRRHGLR